MGYLRQTLDRIRTRPAADEWLIDTGLSLTGAVFALAVPVWLVCTVALVWRHGALEPVFAFLSVFAGLFVIAGIAYGAGYLGWLAVARWLRGLVARVAATWPRGLAPAIMGICAALGVVLALAASIPLVTVTSQLTAFPAQGQFRLDAPYQTYESVDQASARSIVPLLVDLRQATDGGRAFSDRPLAQPQPSRPLLIEPAGNLPIDPMTALGILAVLEALVALVRRGRIGLSGHALALTGLAGLGYLVALPYWAAGIARLAVDAESFITNPNLPIERLSLSFVTAPGYWLFLLASLALACAGLLLNALKQAGAPAQPPTAGI